MGYCQRYAAGAPKWCTTRPQCFDTCRAGWLPAAVACQECGRPTVGPFVVAVWDDGSDQVFYALICADCAHAPDPNAGPTPEDRRGVMMMTECPVRRDPNVRGR